MGFGPVLKRTSGMRMSVFCRVAAAAKVCGGYERSLPCRAFSHQKDATVKIRAQAATTAAAGREPDVLAAPVAITYGVWHPAFALSPQSCY